jgi:peptide deformylase
MSAEVGTLTAEEREFVKDLVHTMYEYDGVGIAAPQVGVLKRIIVVSPESKPGTEKVYLNPKIISQEGEEVGVEGCLSVPGVSGEVRRAKTIRVEAQDLDARPLDFKAAGFEARIVQHEIDHLNGKLFIDRIGFKQRQDMVANLRAFKRM